MNAAPPTSAASGPSAFYRAVWRWHFYAGLITAPLAIFLAISGSIYLWKPQYEAQRYRTMLEVPVVYGADFGGPRVPLSWPVDSQLGAALAAQPGARPVSFTPSFAAGRTSETILRLPDGDTASVFVDPHLGRVAGMRRESERFMAMIQRLHGTLLAGRAGDLVVELGASWLFVLLLTGFYLWWPRPKFSVWGFLLPRLRAHGRIFWRDVHAVPAVWCSLGALFLLTTGMPWTTAGGAWLRRISAVLGEGSPREASAGAHRSELTGWSPPLRAGLAAEIDALASAPPAAVAPTGDPAAQEWCGALPGRTTTATPISLARVIRLAAEDHVPQPYTIGLPVGDAGVFSVISDRNQAFTRTYLHLDQYSGRVLADVRYDDFGAFGKFFLWGIIAHEGRLFGLANQILGTCAALGVILLAGSGLVLWWQRRPAERFVAPRQEVSLPRPVLAGLLALACILPLLAASLLVLWSVDRVVRQVRPAPVRATA